MYYHYPVTIPKNTLAASPINQRLTLALGTINTIFIEFPAGCSGYVGARLFYKTVPIVPFNRDIWIVTDNRTIDALVEVLADEPPFEIEIDAYNEDDTYNHTVNVGVNLVQGKAKTLAELLLELG